MERQGHLSSGPLSLAPSEKMNSALAHPTHDGWPAAGGMSADASGPRLRHMKPSARVACRWILRLYGARVLSVEGAQHISAGQDPFILALNHSQKREAVLIPAVLAALLDGRQVHFMADWNFLMIPLIGFVIRCNDPIIVDRKSARPRFLNMLKPWLTSRTPVMDQARNRLREGRSAASRYR